MNSLDKHYLSLLENILEYGIKKQTRNGEVLSVFGRQIRHRMREGFPLLTTKKMAWKSIVTELLWFLRGDTNIKFLVNNNCHIWDGDAYKNYKLKNNFLINQGIDILSQEEFINKIKTDNEFAEKWGELGEIYGAGWRRWKTYKPIMIEKRIKKESILNINFPLLEVEKDEKDDFIGKKFYSNKSQEEYIVVQKVEGGNNSKYLVQFLSNGYTKIASRPNIKRGQVVNQYKPWLNYDKSKYVWRYQFYIDQIAKLINDLKTNPDSRRLMVNAWNVGELDQCVLPPCHYSFQVYTRELSHKERCDLFGHNDSIDRDYSYSKWLDDNGFPKRAISLMWNQRSVDTFLGLPFNIASYGLLLEIIAKEVNMVPDELIGNLGDVHLYSNHIEQAKEQIKREPFELPKVKFPYKLCSSYGAPILLQSWECYGPEDFKLENYQSHPSIKAPLSN